MYHDKKITIGCVGCQNRKKLREKGVDSGKRLYRNISFPVEPKKKKKCDLATIKRALVFNFSKVVIPDYSNFAISVLFFHT